MTRVEVLAWHPTGEKCLKRDGRPLTVKVDGSAAAPPERVCAAVREQLGLDVTLLRVAAPNLAEVECAADAPLAGLYWQHREMQPPPCRRPAWGRPGWLGGVMASIDVELAKLGRTRAGRPEQVRHSSVTGLLRLPTSRGPVWLKALPPLFAHEARTIRWLSQICDHPLPTVLAEGGGWWLAEDFPPPATSPSGDPLVSLARIQITAASRIGELRALGCPDRPLAALPILVRQITDRTDLLDPVDRGRLIEALPPLDAACAEADRLGLPLTIAHCDISPENTRWTDNGWLLYDWTDACLTHPFVDLASPLSYQGVKGAAAARASAYAAVWEEGLPSAAVARALELSPVIGAAHQMANYARIVDAVEPDAADVASRRELVVFLRYWTSRLLAALSVARDEVTHPRPDLVSDTR